MLSKYSAICLLSQKEFHITLAFTSKCSWQNQLKAATVYTIPCHVSIVPLRNDCMLSLKEFAAAAKSHQSCPTLCDSIDSSPPGSPFPGILQVRTLECVAISFSNVATYARANQIISLLCFHESSRKTLPQLLLVEQS